MVTALRHFGIVVRDLPTMLAFYTGPLGLTPVRVMDESGPVLDHLLGHPQVQVRTAKLGVTGQETLLELLAFTNPPSELSAQPENLFRTGPAHLALTVRDLDALHARLTAIGIRFINPPVTSPDGKVKVAFCLDPEGNPLELVQPLPNA